VEIAAVWAVKLTENAATKMKTSECLNLNEFTKFFLKTGVYVSILRGFTRSLFFLRCLIKNPALDSSLYQNSALSIHHAKS